MGDDTTTDQGHEVPPIPRELKQELHGLEIPFGEGEFGAQTHLNPHP